MKMDCKNKKAFSILEVMIAGFVLAIGLVAVSELVTSSLVHSIDSRNNIVAVGLAQEGVELMRNVWDNNKLYVTTSSNCRIDFDDVIAAPMVCGGGYALRMNANYYTHTGGVATRFRRRIVVANVDSTTKRIRSIVKWDNTSPTTVVSDCTLQNKCVYAEAILTNWR